MPQNSIRRLFIQSVAQLIVKKKLLAVNDDDDASIQCNIIKLLPNILNQLTDTEIRDEMAIHMETDPYFYQNRLPLPYFKTAFNLPPPRQYYASDIYQFMVGLDCTSFKQKCMEMKTGRWKPMDVECNSILPAIIAKEVYRICHPCTARINPKTGRPIQKESNAHRKQLNDFETKYRVEAMNWCGRKRNV